jgi:TonB family protein
LVSNVCVITALLLMALAAPAQTAPAMTQAGPPAPDCKQLLGSEPTGDIAALCQAEEAMRLAAAAAEGSPERLQHLRAAADGYARAAQLLQNLELKVYAFEAIVRVHDPSHLNDPRPVEPALRQLATLVAGTPAPLMRLAKFQEDHEAADTAEHTLLGTRQQYPDAVTVLKELAAFFARRVVTLTPKPGAAPPADVPQPKPKETAYRPDCQQFAFGDPSSGIAQLCAAEAEVRKATLPAKPSTDTLERARAVDERKQSLRAAAERYSRAAEILRETDARTYAYEALLKLYAAANLNEPREAEDVIRRLMALAPHSTAPIIRLAMVQEEQKLVDAAENTLLAARQQFPEDVELLKALSKFYGRLATASQLTAYGRELETEKTAPGQPDPQGFYAMGGNLQAPRPTLDRVPMEYPKEAQALGVHGMVELEVRIDETGQVVDARVVRSIPLLDDAAVAAAKRWRFAPAVIDGRPVPSKVAMEMSFGPNRQPGK